MKNIHTSGFRLSLVAILFSAAVPLFGADAASAVEKEVQAKPAPADHSPPPAKTAVVASAAYKDPFLNMLFEKTKQYTGKAEDVIGKAVDAVSTEAPKLAEEYLRWRFWYHAISYAAIIALVCAGLFLVWLMTYFGRKSAVGRTGYHAGEWEDQWQFLTGLAVVLEIIPVIALFAGSSHLFSALQIQLAPKIYLLEQAAHLFK